MTDKVKTVSELQEMLREISKVNSEILSIVPDGIFGEETEDSVKSFQRFKGYNDDGKVNYELWEEIRGEYKNALFILSDPVNIVKIDKERFPLILGETGEEITVLNNMLRKFSDLHSNFTPVEGNTFSTETENNVREFQKIIFYDINGVVDKYTWNRLSEYYLL